jgi:hypothetical protein
MKIELKKHSMTRWCQDYELEQFKAAGWQPVHKEQAGEEVIRLKPPVKSRATVKAPEEAKLETTKGDE